MIRPRAFTLLMSVSAVLLAASPGVALSPVNKTIFGGVAIDGYDPVAYFTDGKPVSRQQGVRPRLERCHLALRLGGAPRSLRAGAGDVRPAVRRLLRLGGLAGLHRRHRPASLEDRERSALPELQSRGAEEVVGRHSGEHRQRGRQLAAALGRGLGGLLELEDNGAADEPSLLAGAAGRRRARLRTAGAWPWRAHARRRAAHAPQRRGGSGRGAGGLPAGLSRPAAIRRPESPGDLAAPDRGQRRADAAAQPPRASRGVDRAAPADLHGGRPRDPHLPGVAGERRAASRARRGPDFGAARRSTGCRRPTAPSCCCATSRSSTPARWPRRWASRRTR